jgi:hypothetical protein
MLIELTIILSTYGSLRFLDKKKLKQKISKAKNPQLQQLVNTDKTPQALAKKNAKKELKISYIALGTSLAQPIFFPSLFLFNAVLLTRSSYSYLKSAEQSLRYKKINNDILGGGFG